MKTAAIVLVIIAVCVVVFAYVAVDKLLDWMGRGRWLTKSNRSGDRRAEQAQRFGSLCSGDSVFWRGLGLRQRFRLLWLNVGN